MLFKDIIGQKEASAHLMQSLKEGRIANTQLFLGKPGSGTLLLAIAYARAILCTELGEEDSCGKCPNCTMVNGLTHPDLHFSFPIILNAKERTSDFHLKAWRKTVLKDPFLNAEDWYAAVEGENKQGVIGKDESLNIMKKLLLRSYGGGYKIMLMWLPETMNAAAANKLLKILEEPADRTVFILVAESIERILPTVISRTQLFKVPKLSTADVAQGLTSYTDLSEEERMAIAMRSDGDLNAAMKDAKDQNGQLLDRFRDWMRICFKKDVRAAIGMVNEIAGPGTGKEQQKALLKYGLHMCRQCLVHEQQLDQLVLSSGSEKGFVKNFSPVLNIEKTDVVQEELNNAIAHIERNANSKIVFMDLTFTLFKLIGK